MAAAAPQDCVPWLSCPPRKEPSQNPTDVVWEMSFPLGDSWKCLVPWVSSMAMNDFPDAYPVSSIIGRNYVQEQVKLEAYLTLGMNHSHDGDGLVSLLRGHV